MRLKEYKIASSLEEADDLLHQSKNNIILGGLLWLKMSDKHYHTGIDISRLNLDQIVEKEDCIEIGGHVTLRQLETSSLCNHYFNNTLAKSVENIVGVQFRNLATVGGSVYSRFGFSEISTLLLALDAKVELYRGGTMSMESFIASKREKDILKKIILDKHTMKVSYQQARKTKTDFPILSVAIGRKEKTWRIAIGARPTRAKLAVESAKLLEEDLIQESLADCISHIKEEISFGSNMRGSKEYREHLAQVFIKKGVLELCE